MYFKEKASEAFLRGDQNLKKRFSVIDQINLFQESYFLYDRSNVIKKTFINETNKFLRIYCSGSFSGKPKRKK